MSGEAVAARLLQEAGVIEAPSLARERMLRCLGCPRALSTARVEKCSGAGSNTVRRFLGDLLQAEAIVPNGTIRTGLQGRPVKLFALAADTVLGTRLADALQPQSCRLDMPIHDESPNSVAGLMAVLVHARHEAGVDREELGRELGLSEARITQMEEGGEVGLSDFVGYAQVLGASVVLQFGDTEPSQPQ